MPPETDPPPLLSDTERAQMLDDIARVGLAVAADALGPGVWHDLDVARGTLAARHCPRERLGFISARLPELTQAVEQLGQSPIVRSEALARRVAPPARARRVGRPALLHAARHGHAGEWLDETVRTTTPDTTENQRVRSFLDTLRRDADDIAALADTVGDAEAAADARRCVGRLRGLLAAPLWEGVTVVPAAWTRPPTLPLLSRPAYALLAGRMGDYRRAFAFDWSHPLFRLPARDLWQLYETWGLFQILRALLTLGCRADAAAFEGGAGAFTLRESRLSLRLAHGEASHIVLRHPKIGPVCLCYQPLYAAGTRSLSRTLQPDMTLETSGSDVFVLDAKLKAYDLPGDESQDMDQMHAYRDAIIAEGAYETPRRVVQRAWCLYAGAQGGSSRPVIAYGAVETSIVGALHLRPGLAAGFDGLCARLGGWLGIGAEGVGG